MAPYKARFPSQVPWRRRAGAVCERGRARLCFAMDTSPIAPVVWQSLGGLHEGQRFLISLWWGGNGDWGSDGQGFAGRARCGFAPSHWLAQPWSSCARLLNVAIVRHLGLAGTCVTQPRVEPRGCHGCHHAGDAAKSHLRGKETCPAPRRALSPGSSFGTAAQAHLYPGQGAMFIQFHVIYFPSTHNGSVFQPQMT